MGSSETVPKPALGPVPGVFGSLQAFEALKLILGLPGQLLDELLVLDLLTLSTLRVRTSRASDCPGHATSRVAGAQARSPADLEISFDSLEQAAAAGYDLIDIREPSELIAAPTPRPGASNIPVAQLLHGEPAFASRRKTLLLCASGRRSLAAAQTLRARGFDVVYSLRGGVTALQAKALS